MGDFNTLKSTAYAWQNDARELICAANILLNSYEGSLGSSSVDKLSFEPNEGCLWRPLMVLYALAVENLLKAIIIARGEDPAPGGTLAKWFKHHRLTDHAIRAKLSFVPKPGLFETLREFIESGKYPIGVNPQSGLRTNWFEYPYYTNTVFDLLEKLEDDLRAVLPNKSFPKTELRNICRCNSSSNKKYVEETV